MKNTNNWILLVIVLWVFHISCLKETKESVPSSKNLVLIVIDGARYSETWGDETKQNIPHLINDLAKSGVIYSHFYNKGFTYTLAGHTSITTGVYQEINNDGSEIPDFPSFFHYWNLENLNDCTSYIIASKDKLAVLGYCKAPSWIDNYKPLINVGIDGLGSGTRHDSVTFRIAKEIFLTKHPKITLISFKEPDYSAHQNNWDDYIKAIKSCDQYIFEIWKVLQNDSFYKEKTIMMVTNDHGRHSDLVADGFVSHGDTCDGCRHIGFFACGPRIKQGEVITTERELTDISTTVARLMGIHFFKGNGKVMEEMLKN